MRRRWLSEKKEDFNERIDHAAERLPPRGTPSGRSPVATSS